MAATWHILKRDIKRLIKVPQSWVILVFLFVLPSLYTWVNVYGFWDPYGHTENLRVCVANEDAGAADGLLGEMDLGTEIERQLEEDTQLGWAFTSREDAIAEVEAGKAFAAFVIPQSFSEDIVSIVNGKLEEPKIEYYVNEKLGPLAPKITDTGADTLTATVNSAFIETAGRVAAEAIGNYLLDAQEVAGSAATKAREHLDGAQESIDGAACAVESLLGTIGESQKSIESGIATLEGAERRTDEIIAELDRTAQDVEDVGTQLSSLAAEGSALAIQGALDLADALSKIQQIADDASSAMRSAEGTADAVASSLDSLAQGQAIAADALRATADELPDGNGREGLLERADSLQGESASLASISEALEAQSERLGRLASSLADQNDIADARASLADANDAQSEFSKALATAAAAMPTSARGTLGELKTLAAVQSTLLREGIDVLGQAQATLGSFEGAIQQTQGLLSATSMEMESVRHDFDAFSAGALADFLEARFPDADAVTRFLAAPTIIRPTVLYPVDAYGIGMAPLFMNLTLWVGSLMLMVLIKLEVDDEGLKCSPTIGQKYFARWMLLAAIAVVQAVVCCMGCMVIGVRCASAPLFFLTTIIAGLTYLSFQYALSTTMHHIGRGLCIVLALAQIPAATGMYPVEMTTGFFQTVYPALPFTHGINALRETINGFYGTQWLEHVSGLILFGGAFLAAGLLVRPLIVNINHLFSKKIISNGLYIAEPMMLPQRPYRFARLMLALFSWKTSASQRTRVQRFMAIYDRFKPVTIILSLGAGFLVAGMLMAVGLDRTGVLAALVIWEVVVLVLAVLVEYTHTAAQSLTAGTLSEEGGDHGEHQEAVS